MKVFHEDSREGGPMSNRATDSQLKRLKELKIHIDKPTWLEAKKRIKDYHQNKRKKSE